MHYVVAVLGIIIGFSILVGGLKVDWIAFGMAGAGMMLGSAILIVIMIMPPEVCKWIFGMVVAVGLPIAGLIIGNEIDNS